MIKKVTDLDKFALEHIFRPYQSLLGYENTLKNNPVVIEDIPNLALDNKEWWNLVIDRIRRIGFYFPGYIQHPLVDLIKRETKGGLK